MMTRRSAITVGMTLYLTFGGGVAPVRGQALTGCPVGKPCIHIMFQTHDLIFGDHYAPQASEEQCRDRAKALWAAASERNAKVPGGGQVLLVECVNG